jgi:hypothetical protein
MEKSPESFWTLLFFREWLRPAPARYRAGAFGKTA